MKASRDGPELKRVPTELTEAALQVLAPGFLQVTMRGEVWGLGPHLWVKKYLMLGFSKLTGVLRGLL